MYKEIFFQQNAIGAGFFIYQEQPFFPLVFMFSQQQVMLPFHQPQLIYSLHKQVAYPSPNNNNIIN